MCDRLTKTWHFIIRFSWYFFSYPPRHCPHRQKSHLGVRVLGEGPQAVYGRLWRHPGHEQRQAVPLSGKQDDHLSDPNWPLTNVSDVERTGVLPCQKSSSQGSQAAESSDQWERRAEGENKEEVKTKPPQCVCLTDDPLIQQILLITTHQTMIEA